MRLCSVARAIAGLAGDAAPPLVALGRADLDEDVLEEAGFSDVTVYWEGTDEENNEGNGIYEPSECGDADPGWVCYIVAVK